jgi:predicted ATPase
VWAHVALGWTLYELGELPAARTHAEQGIVRYDPQQRLRSTILTADAKVQCLTYGTWTLWLLGYPDQARQWSQEAVAAGLAHPFSLAMALGSAATVHALRREGPRARARAEELITLATEQGFPWWTAWGTMEQGWALAEQGQVHEGIARMLKMPAPFMFAHLAEAYGKLGQIEEGLTVVAKALARADETGMRVHEAELYRLRGELVLQSAVHGPQSENPNTQHLTSSTHAQAEAEACFLKAIALARGQSAKSWELRAGMSLSRLWRRQGKKAEAHRLLAEIYGWFTEGFDTKDLQEAKTLLHELRENTDQDETKQSGV